MNTETGVIKELHELENMSIQERGNFVEILNKDMTTQQSINRKVSLHDNKSKLGKQFTEIRKSRIIQRNHRRK